MNFPKLVIATDGTYTGVLLDGVFIGQGIERLDFSTESKNGETKSTIRVMELNVDRASLRRGAEYFSEFLEKMAEAEKENDILKKFSK